MDEDNYFKLVDQYIGTPKLVSKPNILIIPEIKGLTLDWQTLVFK